MPEGAKKTEFLPRINGFITELWQVVNIELCLPQAPFRKSRCYLWKNMNFIKLALILSFFRNGACGKQSTMLTTCHNSVLNPLILGIYSVFLAPSGMNLILRYALLHLASLGFRNRLRSVSNSSLQGRKNWICLPRKIYLPLCCNELLKKDEQFLFKNRFGQNGPKVI